MVVKERDKSEGWPYCGRARGTATGREECNEHVLASRTFKRSESYGCGKWPHIHYRTSNALPAKPFEKSRKIYMHCL